MKRLNKKMFTKHVMCLLSTIALQSVSLTYGAAVGGAGTGDVKDIGIVYDEDDRLEARYAEELNTETVKHMSATIREYFPLAEVARDKDITVFVGNTGAGKSTTLNILGGNGLVVNRFGEIELAKKAEGFAVGAGCKAITTYPQSIESPVLGTLFDMPGFQDTGGAVKDLLNAGLMKAILERASTVKVVLVLSKPEVEAMRTKGLRDVMKHIQMFPDALLESSMSIVLTKVTPEIIGADGQIDHEWFMRYIPAEDSPEVRLIHRLVDAKKVRVMPQASKDTPIEALKGTYKELLEGHLSTLGGVKLKSLRMGMTLSTESTQELQKYFSTIFLKEIKGMSETDWKAAGLTSAALGARKAEYQRQLIERVEASEGIVVLRPLGEDQFTEVAADMVVSSDGIFNSTFTITVHEMAAREHATLVEEAWEAAAEAAERERIAREAEVKAIDEKNFAKAAEEKAKREAAEADVKRAEANAKEAEEKRKTAEIEARKAKEQKRKAWAKFMNRCIKLIEQIFKKKYAEKHA